jgi:hypothetical protein
VFAILHASRVPQPGERVRIALLDGTPTAKTLRGIVIARERYPGGQTSLRVELVTGERILIDEALTCRD